MKNKPRPSKLWPGAILGTIAKSVATAIHPEFDSLQSWSGPNYVVQGWDGRHGAVTFDGPQGSQFDPKNSFVVGAFYSIDSARCPGVGKSQTAMDSIFRGCPERHRQLAVQGALQFLLFEAHPGGPCATTAFWNIGDALDAANPWESVLENGAELLDAVLIEDMEQALQSWVREFQLDTNQLDLARSIYLRRMQEPDMNLPLSEVEAAYLASLSDDPDAITNCRMSFADIRVLVP